MGGGAAEGGERAKIGLLGCCSDDARLHAGAVTSPCPRMALTSGWALAPKQGQVFAGTCRSRCMSYQGHVLARAGLSKGRSSQGHAAAGACLSKCMSFDPTALCGSGRCSRVDGSTTGRQPCGRNWHRGCDAELREGGSRGASSLDTVSKPGDGVPSSKRQPSTFPGLQYRKPHMRNHHRSLPTFPSCPGACT